MPTTPSATTTVNGSAVSGAIAVAASSTVTLALASTFGVRSVSYTIVGNHESAATNPTITSGSDFTATFPMPAGTGQAYLIETKINGGRDELGRADSAYTFRFVVGVNTASGIVPGALGEKTERGTYGWLSILNTLAGEIGSVIISKAAGHTITVDDWAGANPATTPLVVLVSAAAAITFPSDSALVNGARIVLIKSESGSYAVSATLTTGTIQLRSSATFGSAAPHQLYNGSGRIVCGDFTYAGAWLSNTIIPRTDGYITENHLEVDGYSLVGKSTTGTGAGESITFAENRIAGRETGSNLTSTAPQKFYFENNETAFGGTPTLRVAPEETHSVSALATGANADYDTDPGANGYFQFTVLAVAKMATAGTYHRVSAVIDAIRTGGTLTVRGTQVDLSGGDSTGLTLTLSATSGSLRANLANATGETVNGYVNVGWLKTDEIA
jgi:hypothetical protein